ncbi:hypothetical protein [Alienimonas californiensis]|uniref:hypothetical protein n=1 Tax=Alienimonas californiensis TaxID=2527989 RepID=UPI0013FD002E|nr:hypothetical protein [Alienimonas californiensis]
MRFPPRFAPLALTVAAAATTLCGCGLHRHISPRPDYDLPMGFSGTYRFNLVVAGEVPAGPTDREALSRMGRGPAAAPAGPFAVPLTIEPGGALPPGRRVQQGAGPPPGFPTSGPPGQTAPGDAAPDQTAPEGEVTEPLLPSESASPDANAPPPDDPAALEGPLA